MSEPKGLRYTNTHEWIRDEQENMTMGITNHAQALLGDMVFVELPRVGDRINAGDEIGVVESVKAASDFYSPISGEVIEVNPMVTEDPGIVNRDPYGAGWLVKIKSDNPEEVKDLLSAEEYEQEIAEDN
ncbi:glycine cleavage system H protein (plasmid) [Legionella adelaidensis]|uniref:Glycine cleavage system H protein n=1 Tax=Legionella adelaidensis TaxID=45056 RepID=A0A0W0R0R1_9GAMM|nr:glycine cleavage system protein GcvH [Legionella adelaidensis]KTC64663.1 glycine cleavage system H protein [Legionella adelaidensis]VEH86131.1 glycine cleavage system H protein [Legionella adelaidensis]